MDTSFQAHGMYTTKNEPYVNYGLCVIMMCQCRFILLKKCTILVCGFDNRGGYACVGAGRIWEISVPSSPGYFVINLKLLQKIKS